MAKCRPLKNDRVRAADIPLDKFWRTSYIVLEIFLRELEGSEMLAMLARNSRLHLELEYSPLTAGIDAYLIVEHDGRGAFVIFNHMRLTWKVENPGAGGENIPSDHFVETSFVLLDLLLQKLEGSEILAVLTRNGRIHLELEYSPLTAGYDASAILDNDERGAFLIFNHIRLTWKGESPSRVEASAILH